MNSSDYIKNIILALTCQLLSSAMMRNRARIIIIMTDKNVRAEGDVYKDINILLVD